MALQIFEWTYCFLIPSSLFKPINLNPFLKKKKIFIYLFWLHRVLLEVRGLLSCGMHAGSHSPTRDQTWAPCVGSAASYPLDNQGSPVNPLTISHRAKNLRVSDAPRLSKIMVHRNNESKHLLSSYYVPDTISTLHVLIHLIFTTAL